MESYTHFKPIPLKIKLREFREQLKAGYCAICKQNHNNKDNFDPSLCEYPVYHSPQYPRFMWVNYCKKYDLDYNTGKKK